MSTAKVIPLAPVGVVLQIIADGEYFRVVREGPASDKLRDLLLGIASELRYELNKGADFGTRAAK